MSNEPHWWRNITKHRKGRAKLKLALHEQYRASGDVLYPLDKKPWEYYW